MRCEPFFAAGLLLAACQPAAVDMNLSREAPEPVQDTWVEIPEAKISFVRMHPGAAQKNVYVDWKCFEDRETHARVYRVQGKAVSAEAAGALDALRKAALDDLIPSDGLYACRYRENMPQFRIEFVQDSQKVQVLSSSDCKHAAPFNVIRDGRHYIQVTGAFGEALAKALELSGKPIHIGETEGLFMFSEKVQIDWAAGEKQDSPAKWYDAVFRKDEAFGAMLGAVERNFGALPLPEVACNQARSPRCDAVSARYQVRIGERFFYSIPLKYDGRSVSAQIVPGAEWDALAKAAKSNVFQAVAQSVTPSQDIQLIWSDAGAESAGCKMVRGLAKHFELPDTVSCSAWRFHCEACSAMIYYVGLDAVWFEPQGAYKTYFAALKQLQGKKKVSYSKYMAPDKATNLFVRINGRPIAFVTRNGKTTIE